MYFGSSGNILKLSLTKSNSFCKYYLPVKSRRAIDWTKLRESGSPTQGSGYLNTEMMVYSLRLENAILNFYKICGDMTFEILDFRRKVCFDRQA